jgi:hypothetical protein
MIVRLLHAPVLLFAVGTSLLVLVGTACPHSVTDDVVTVTE